MAHAISTHTGLTQWRQGPEVTTGILEGVLLFFARRRTQRALAQLDDRMLEDIGLSRGDIDLMAVQAVSTTVDDLASEPETWLTRLLRVQARARMVRELRNLPDYILNDIGIQRGLIEESVYRAMAETKQTAKSETRTVAHDSPVHGLLRRVEAAAWPFRRRHAAPDQMGGVKTAANLNEAQAKVA